MRILLINPPRSPHNAILEHARPDVAPFIHKKLVGPPLGLLTVAGALRDRDVTLLEMKAEYDLHADAPPPDAMVREWVRRVKPDVVGVTFIASEFDLGLDVFREVKRISPDIVTVAGGLHVTLCPGHFNDPAIDVLCPGQSARVFRELVRALEAGRPAASVPGTIARVDDRLVAAPPLPRPVDGADADFVMPDRSLLGEWASTYTVGNGYGPATYLFTSLGCTHQCSFCSIWPQYGGCYHQRRVESVIEELRTLDGYPVVRFADANSLVDAKFLDRLFDRIAEEGIEKDFIMDMRVDAVARNPRLIEKLARGGLKVVISGFESPRNEELAAYNKSLDAKYIREAVEVFHANGLMIRGNYVVPPDYTHDDFEALAEYASSHAVAYAGYTILSPMPGTPFHEEVKDRIVETDLAKFNFFNSVLKTALPPGEFHSRVSDLWRIRKGTDVI